MQQQPQKEHFSFKGLYHFVHHTSEIRSQDPQRRAEAIQQAAEGLRRVAKPGREMQVDTFEDILKDMEEAIRGWPQHSIPDKRIAGGFFAFNLVLLPVILSWGKPNTLPQTISLMAIIVSMIFNIFYLLIRIHQEQQRTITVGCGLSLMQYVFEIGTICVIVTLLWSFFPPAIVTFVIASLTALLIWIVNMFRDAIIAAHLRRFPSPPDE